MIDGKAYVVGGWNFSTFFTELWMYDPVLDAWTQKASLPGPGRQTGVAFAIDGIGYYGTGNDSNTKFNDWYAYDPVADAWTQKASLPGNGRNGAVGWVLDGQGYVATGDAPNYSNAVFRYDPQLDTWTTLPTFAGTARRYAAGFVLDGFAYICNGQGSMGHGNTCWRFDPADGSWEQRASYPTGCSGGMAVTVNGRAQLFAGYNGASYQSAINEYDPLADSWTALAPFTGGIRAYATTFTVDGEGYVGMGFGTAMQNDLWKVGGIPTATQDGTQAQEPFLYPTVSDGRMTLVRDPGVSAAALLHVLDASGRLVAQVPVAAERTALELDLAPGLHVARLLEGASARTMRFVVVP